jgi:hypothetical protein
VTNPQDSEIETFKGKKKKNEKSISNLLSAYQLFQKINRNNYAGERKCDIRL